jgi:hypothetical protein
LIQKAIPIATTSAGLADSVIFQIGLVLAGVLLGGWLSQFMRRPNVKMVGGGGGAAAFTVRIANAPRVFWLPETRILWWRVHRDRTIGPVIDPSPVRGLQASLYEKGSRDLITHLFWQLSDGTIKNEVTLASGDEASLLIFHRGSDNHRYFVWRPNTDWTGSAPPPVVEAQYSGTREFRVEVHDMYGKRMLLFPAKMTLTPEGRLIHSSPVGGGTF